MHRIIGSFKSFFSTYANLPREIYVLFVARIINRFGGFVHAFLSLFLTIRLGMGPFQTGQIIALLGIAGMAGAYLGSFLGDVLGRKRTYVAAQGLAAALLVPCGFLGNSMMVPYLLIASTFFNNMVRPLATAMVVDIVDPEDRKRAFSLLYYGINIGVAIGPLVAGFLFNNYIQWLFWGDALTTFISLAFIIIYVGETKMTKEEMQKANEAAAENEKVVEGHWWQRLTIVAFLKKPVLLSYTLFSILTGFVYSQSGYALPLDLTRIFGETGGPEKYGVLMSFNAFVVLVFTIIITKVTDRFRPIFNIAFAAVLYAVGFGIMAFVDTLPLIVISVFIWTVGEIQGVTNSGVFVAGHTPISHRSRFNGVINLVQSAGYMLAPIISGKLLELYSMKVLWIIVAITAGVAAVGQYLVGLLDIRLERKQLKNPLP